MITISFSGLDGAGKSTQIELLKKYLTAKDRKCCVITMYDDVSIAKKIRWFFSLKWIADRKTRRVVSPNKKSLSLDYRMDKNYFSWGRFCLRMIAYVADVIHLWWIVLTKSLFCDVLILDRYIYDSLVNLLTHRSAKWVKWYVRFLTAIGPKIDFPIFLILNPDVAFARKREYELGYLIKRDEAYKDFFTTFVPHALWIEASMDMKAIHNAIKEKVNAKRKK